MKADELKQIAAMVAEELRASLVLTQKEVLTLDEVVAYTGFKKNYIYKLAHNRLIPYYRPSGKSCFFRRKEVDEWLTSIPVATDDELREKAYEVLRSLSDTAMVPGVMTKRTTRRI